MKFAFPFILVAVTSVLFSAPVKAQSCCDSSDCSGSDTCKGACCSSLVCNPTERGSCVQANNNGDCFSADATVQVLGKGRVSMKDLAVGDQVVTGGETNKYEPVYGWGHWNPTQEGEFVKITTSLPEHRAIELSPGHLIKVDGRFVKASSVKVGDTLQGDHDVPIKVKKVKSHFRDGVYAPLTPSGTILVDGVLASSYVSMQTNGNEYNVFANGVLLPISQQRGIHMVVAPLRMLCMGVSSYFCEIKNNDGVASWVDWGMRFCVFADEQSLVVQLLMLMLALIVGLPLYAVECLVGAKFAPLAILASVLAGAWAKKTMVRTFAFLTTGKKTEKVL